MHVPRSSHPPLVICRHNNPNPRKRSVRRVRFDSSGAGIITFKQSVDCAGTESRRAWFDSTVGDLTVSSSSG